MDLLKINKGFILSLINIILLFSFNVYSVDKIHLQPVEPPRTTAVCLYPEENWKNEPFCLESSQSIDLYKNSQPQINNDETASIVIPKGMQATVYKNDNFHAPYYTLMENINGEQLHDIGMYQEISSVKATNEIILPCDQNCIILKDYALSLDDIFGTHWNRLDKPNKKILLHFSVNQQNDFFVNLKGKFDFILEGRKLTFSRTDNNQVFSFDLRDETQNLSLLLQLENNILRVQYLESINTEMINHSPMFDFPWPYLDDTPTVLTMFNLSTTPLLLKNIVMTVNSLNTRPKRSFISTLSCWAIAPLAIYNYVVQGHCRQVDNLAHKISELFHGDSTKIAGQSEMLPLQITSDRAPPSTEIAPGTQILKRISANINKAGLTLPAAARSCNTPLVNVIRGRYPRQPSRPCAQWVSQVLADFTTLFGYSLRTWSSDYFNTLIGNIIEHQRFNLLDDDTAIEYNSEPDIERRLIHIITTQVEDQGQRHVRDTITQAFEYSQQNYAGYLTHAVGAANAQPLLLPRAAQELPLGYYELDLLSYRYQETPVRILQNGQWITSTDHFGVEIIDGSREETLAARTTVLQALNQWREEYNSQVTERDSTNGDSTNGELTPASAIIDAGKILSHTLADALEHYLGRGTDQFFVVRLNGRIISILLSDSIYNSDNAEIAASLTHPDYVLRPRAEGTIRGAGTAAVRTMALYMQAKGRKKVTTEVISQPSAIVHSKLGFHSTAL